VGRTSTQPGLSDGRRAWQQRVHSNGSKSWTRAAARRLRRMAEFGTDIIFVDLTDQYRVIEDLNAALGRAAVHFH
jgi:hypothetical protein